MNVTEICNLYNVVIIYIILCNNFHVIYIDLQLFAPTHAILVHRYANKIKCEYVFPPTRVRCIC